MVTGSINEDTPQTEERNPPTSSLIRVPQNIDYFDGYGIIYPRVNTTQVASVNENTPQTEESYPTTSSIIMVAQNIDCFNGYGICYLSINTTQVASDDEIYLMLSGDCVSSGRGIILSNFSISDPEKLDELENSRQIINATLIVNFKTCEDYNSSTYFEWTIGNNFLNTTIHPENISSEITEQSLLFQDRYKYNDLTDIKIKYFNPQGGKRPVFIFIDYIWIEIFYET
jgi:hypothetical protein